MSSVALEALSSPLLTGEEFCEDRCLICLENVSEAAAFLHPPAIRPENVSKEGAVLPHNIHPVHIDPCLKVLIGNLKGSEPLLCVHCRQPIPEAMVHADPSSAHAKRMAAYRAEAGGAGDPPDPLDDVPLHLVDVPLDDDGENYTPRTEVYFREGVRDDDDPIEESRRCTRRIMGLLATTIAGGCAYLIGHGQGWF